MAGNEPFFVQELLELSVKIAIRSPHVGKGSRTPSAWGRELMGKKQGVASPPGVKTGVGVKEGISLDMSVYPCSLDILLHTLLALKRGLFRSTIEPSTSILPTSNSSLYFKRWIRPAVL